MADYSEAYKKYVEDRLGMSIDKLDNIFASEKTFPATTSGKAEALKLNQEKIADYVKQYSDPDVIKKARAELKLPEYNFAKDFEKNMVRANVGKAASVLGRTAGPVIGAAQVYAGMQDLKDKVKAGASYKEAATDPEVAKGLARGVLG